MRFILLVVAVVVLGLPLICLGHAVHCALIKYCYEPYARKWCRMNGFKTTSWQSGYLFYPASTGLSTKHEWTAVELNCFDQAGQPCLVTLAVYVTGVKRVLTIKGPSGEDLTPTVTITVAPPSKITGPGWLAMIGLAAGTVVGAATQQWLPALTLGAASGVAGPWMLAKLGK